MFGIIAASGTATTAILKSLTFIGSDSTTSSTSIAYPPGTVANDIAIVFRINEASSLPNSITNYTSITSTSPVNASLNGIVSYKQLTASDISAGSASFVASPVQTSTMSMILVFRPNFTVTNITSTVQDNTVNTTTLGVNIPTASTSGSSYIGLGHFASSTSTFLTLTQSPTGTMSEIDHGTTGGGRSQTILYRIFNEGTTAQGIGVSTSDAGTNLAQTIALRVL